MRKGAIEVLIPVVFLSIAVFILIAVALSCHSKDIDTVVESEVLVPSVNGISANSFFEYMPSLSGKTTSNIISVYASTKDEAYRAMIESSLKEFFTDKRVEVVIDDVVISNGISSSESFNLVTKNVFTPGGMKAINMRFYK